jgi:tetratricopeptide (TPR) repeat protein
LWKSASEANYNPSTVSLARDILLHGSWGESEVWKDIEKRFVQLIAEGKDCNALTAYGESLFNAGKYSECAETLEQAVRVDDGIFGWKRTCLTCLAKSYAMLGKVSEAKETLKTLGDADADAEIDQFLNTSDAERARQQMYSAALMGRTDMYRQLAEFEFEREANETDKESKKNHHLWGMEWSRLANPSAKF